MFQNNHHKLSSRVNFGVKKWEADHSYLVIWALDKVGIIQLRLVKLAAQETAAAQAAAAA